MLTIHPGFLDAFALIAAILIIFGAIAWFLCKFTPDAFAWLFPEPLDDDNDDQAEYRAAHVSRLDALDSDRLRVCGHSNGALSCDRAALHTGPHGDRHTMPGDRPVLWIDGDLGLRSLDEIRRDADEWGGPDAA